MTPLITRAQMTAAITGAARDARQALTDRDWDECAAILTDLAEMDATIRCTRAGRALPADLAALAAAADAIGSLIHATLTPFWTDTSQPPDPQRGLALTAALADLADLWDTPAPYTLTPRAHAALAARSADLAEIPDGQWACLDCGAAWLGTETGNSLCPSASTCLPQDTHGTLSAAQAQI